MPLTLDLAQTVVIGRFNPYIITPAWLLDGKHGICSAEEAEEQPEPDDFDADDSGFVLAGFEWETSFDRLAVSSTKPEKDCGAKAAALLRQLPHTPVEAVGNNFIFVCDTATWGERPMPALAGTQAPPPVESRWVGRYREEDGRIEVELMIVPNRVAVLRLNFDYRVNGTDEAARAASRFRSDYDRTRQRVRDLFRIEIP